MVIVAVTSTSSIHYLVMSVFQVRSYGMVAFLYTEGIQQTAAHSGSRYTDLTQEEVQHLWRYNLYSQGKYFNEFSSRACWLSVL